MDQDLNQSLRRCLSGPDGLVVLDYLCQQIAGMLPLTVVGQSGADPVYAAFRDGGVAAYKDILERSGYEISFRVKEESDDYLFSDTEDRPGH